METLDPSELLALAVAGRDVFVVRGKPRECVFQFDRFLDYVQAGNVVVTPDARTIAFPGGGTVTFVTLADVRQGRLRGVDNPLVAASAYYHHHELDAHLPGAHERVDWC